MYNQKRRCVSPVGTDICMIKRGVFLAHEHTRQSTSVLKNCSSISIDRRRCLQVAINEDVDPVLVLARLRQENTDLRIELKYAELLNISLVETFVLWWNKGAMPSVFECE
jgi:hypothetical protein